MKIEIKYSNRKTVALHVRDGVVSVRAPFGTSRQLIDSFVDEKASWIQKHLDAYEPVGFIWGQDSIRYFGNKIKITYKVDDAFSISYDYHSLMINYPLKWSKKKLEQSVINIFKSQLDVKLETFIREISQHLKIKVPPYKIRVYKRIHGRCTRGGEVAFNTYLFHESDAFIKYVVLHECAHILEFNHGPKFYAIIEKHMPDYKNVIKEQKGRYKIV